MRGFVEVSILSRDAGVKRLGNAGGGKARRTAQTRAGKKLVKEAR